MLDGAPFDSMLMHSSYGCDISLLYVDMNYSERRACLRSKMKSTLNEPHYYHFRQEVDKLRVQQPLAIEGDVKKNAAHENDGDEVEDSFGESLLASSVPTGEQESMKTATTPKGDHASVTSPAQKRLRCRNVASHDDTDETVCVGDDVEADGGTPS